MFILMLKFSENKAMATQNMPAHKVWLKRGFDDGVFLVAGSLQPSLGGAVLAHNTTLEDLNIRLAEDPFVEMNIVKAEILEVSPSMTDERFSFLLG